MNSKNIFFQKKVLRILRNLKFEKKEPASNPIIPVYNSDKLIAYLRIASINSLSNKEEIRNLAKWRQQHNAWFPTQFNVTESGTRKWFIDQVLESKDRLLFILETPSGVPFGHMGLYRFDFSKRSCEIDNVVRGEDYQPGAMTCALQVLIDWAFSTLEVKSLYLRVFSDNLKAIELYRRCGFQEVDMIPLQRVEEKDRVSWVESNVKDKKAARYFLRMRLYRT